MQHEPLRVSGEQTRNRMKGGANMGKLYLLPTPLSEGGEGTVPEDTLSAMRRLHYFIVEKTKTARRWISKLGHPRAIRSLTFYEIPKHHHLDAYALLEGCRKGYDMGLMSEAGAPCVADPGGAIVRVAHELGIEVVPLVGPSALLLALMGSGLNGQQFAFLGYLPSNKTQLIDRLHKMEQRSSRNKETLMFIETPYRNNQILTASLEALHPNTLLSIAVDLTDTGEQWVKTKTIRQWRGAQLPELHKRPVVYSILA